MKKYTLLLIILLFCNHFMFSQEEKNSLKINNSEPIFYDRLSPEESWKLHKKQYLQKLKAQGFSVNEIDKKLKTYNKQKEKFLKNLKVQREIAKSNRYNAGIIRDKAAVERRKAEERRDEAEKRSEEAETERKLAKVWRNSFENVLTKKITLKSSNRDIQLISFELKIKASLLFIINGELNSGTTSIEIFNPNGIMEGRLSLGYKSSQNNEESQLKPNLKSISKLINDAEIGIWQLKIKTQKSEGFINISIDKNTNETTED